MQTTSLPYLRLEVPQISTRAASYPTLAAIARLIASGQATSKADLVGATELSRTTVSGAVDALMRAGIVRRAGTRPPAGRGRPADNLELAGDTGIVLIVDAGAHTTRFAIADANQRIWAARTEAIDVRRGYAETMAEFQAVLEEMLAEVAIASTQRVLVLGVPARVDYERQVAVRPPIMPGWDGRDLGGPLSEAFDCTLLLENDTNLRALGESRALAPDQLPLLTLKVGTGVGGGFITSFGRIHRGKDGASGEVGHMQVRDAPPALCQCGNTGCLEAVASVPALIRRYGELGGTASPQFAGDLVKLVQSGDHHAIRAVREGAAYIGAAMAGIVNIINPARLVLGGEIVQEIDDILAGVRAEVYQHARPLATRNLVLARSVLGTHAGIAGAMVMGIEHLLSPQVLAESLHPSARARPNVTPSR